MTAIYKPRRDADIQTSGEISPINPLFGLLASRTVRQYISVVSGTDFSVTV